ncbi:MAG: hypothetical protein ABI359_13720 [Ginsengibacter sp.]
MKPTTTKLSLTFLLFLFFALQANSQDIDKTLETYGKEYSAGKMYLHYDKNSYASGETIWFKSYLMKGMFPDDESKTAYVDWIGDDGKILLHSVCAIENAASFGQFEVPQNYAGRFIHVRAYTKWMLNFDSSFWYNKNIKILSDSKFQTASKNVIQPELIFFPEGGDVIEGVLNKIVFKANDQFGNPIQIEGAVKNNSGSFIDSLTIIHNGMGFFFIRPQPGETFTAIWQDENGEDHTSPLPQSKNSGLALHVTIAPNKRNFSVSAAPGSLGSIKTVHILGTMYQQKIFQLDEAPYNGTYEGSIPTESLPSGILTITVFDQDWKPQSERITYINNEEYIFHPEITIQKKGVNKREKNEVSITLPNDIASDFSVSVTDSKIDHDNSDNIISHLLLTGELIGKVYDPAYYFLNNSDSITRQLDLVMLTHGWRRFNWEKVVKGQFPEIKYPKDTSYISLSGIISGATPLQLKKAGDIILMFTEKNSGTQTFTIPIQEDGTFNDPSLILFDTAHIFYSLSNTKNLQKVSVQFMPGILPRASNYLEKNSFYELPYVDSSLRYHIMLNDSAQHAMEFFKGKVLATVNIKTRIKSNKELLNEKYTSGVFKNQNATQLDLVNDPLAISYTDIVSYIEGKVPGLTYDNVASKFLWMRNRAGENGPTLYINEMPTTYDMLSSIPVSNVAFIKVFRPGFVGGGGTGTGGAIVIYTRLGADGQPLNGGKKLNDNMVTGYTAIREFYSPDYDSTDQNDKKDLRTTLYWNPSIITAPGQGSASFSFFNNDVTKSFRVIIEGMNKEGQLAHIEKEIE